MNQQVALHRVRGQRKMTGEPLILKNDLSRKNDQNNSYLPPPDENALTIKGQDEYLTNLTGNYDPELSFQKYGQTETMGRSPSERQASVKHQRVPSIQQEVG